MLRPRSSWYSLILALVVAHIGMAIPASASVGDGRGITLLQCISSSLEHTPALLSEKQALRVSEAALEEARSWYDPNVSLSSTYMKEARSMVNGGNLHVFSSRLSVTQRLPSGITVTPAITLDRSATNADGSITTNSASSGITIILPLFRGFGKNNIYRTTREAAGQLLEAEKQAFVNVLETTIYGTASVYWNYVYVWRQRELARRLTESAESQLKATRALAQAELIAPLMIDQANAYLRQAKAAEITAVLSVEEIWQELLLAIGLDPSLHAVPEAPMDSFPIPSETFCSEMPAIDALQSLAANERADLHASRLQSASSSTLLEGYRNQLGHDISLQLWGGYSGSSIGNGFGDYLSSATQQIPGANLGATITWEIDAGNRADHAAYIRQQAQLELCMIQESQLERSIKSGVVIALAAVRNAGEVYRLNLKSADAYRRLKDGELQKFRMGMSDIFNLQSASNNLALAEQQLLMAEKSFAMAVLELRRSTGMLVEDRDGMANIRAANLLTVPQTAGGRP